MSIETLNQARPKESLTGHVDVLIVGAGISGIGLAHYLVTTQPEHTFAIVDSRDAIGGTWDLFRYPGIRSDSDLHTFGYEFKPWTSDNAIADAHEILDYLHEVIDEDGLAERIYFQHKVIRADFCSETARWTVVLERDGKQSEVTCGWLFSATGYYDYAAGHSPHFEGQEDFEGVVVHPQSWPEDLDYRDKQVVVIGSGATAVTLIPAMADDVAHITMLQRSPTYVMPLPRKDPIANGLRKVLPDKTRLPDHPRDQQSPAAGDLHHGPASPEGGAPHHPRTEHPGAAQGLRPGHPLQSDLQARGTSGCARCPTTICSRPSPAARRRWSPTRSCASPRPGSCWSRVGS